MNEIYAVVNPGLSQAEDLSQAGQVGHRRIDIKRGVKESEGVFQVARCRTK